MPILNYNSGDVYLKISSWFIGHKDFFRKWWVILIISINIIMLVYIVASFLIYFLETPRYNQMLNDMSRNFIDLSYKKESQPKELEVLLTKAIYNSGQKFDILAKVRNPNSKWGIESFKYKFNLDGEETNESTGFFLPAEEKYLLSLNITHEGNANIQSVEFIMSDIKWQKFSDEVLLSKIKFSVEDENISLGEMSSNTTTTLGTVLSATITNESIFGFWEVGVPIVLKVQGEPVAVNYYAIRELDSYGSKEISVSWLYDIALSAEIDIVPEVDILEEGNFMSS